MPATIKIKNSSTASAVPTSSDLVQGELAVNVTDKRIFTENASGTVVELGTNPSILTLPDGSASAPTLTNDGDTNTGIFFPAADTVGIATGGTERARVDSSGNLGVGTTSPTSNRRLDAVLNSNASTGIRVANNDAGGSASANASYSNGTNSHEFGILGTGYTTYGVLAAGDAYIYASGSKNIALSADGGVIKFGAGTNGVERARIDSSGNLLVGATNVGASVGSGIAIRPSISGTIGDIDIGHASGAASGSGYMQFVYDGSIIGNITQNGTTGVTYATSSDYRLKENIAPMTGALAKVALLKPCTYTWKADGAAGQGFIAHELQAIVPDAVVGEKDAVDADGNPKYQGIDTSFLVATLTAAIQELKAEFEAYKASHP